MQKRTNLVDKGFMRILRKDKVGPTSSYLKAEPSLWGDYHAVTK